jgi:heme a synthase
VSAQRRLTLAAVALAFVVIVVGAYVRLSHSGLGCPDWPLCYGQVTPGDHLGVDARDRAWNEMAHRYLAGGLGLLIAGLFVAAWRRRGHRALTAALVLVVLFQATLGMWTVTLLLKPAIVAGHLLGGMATLSLLVWLFLAQGAYAPAPEARALRIPALVALVAVVMQIALGGWVSANYAALACPDLPLCQGAALPPMDFGHAFHMLRGLGETSDGARLPDEALTAIHWTHRVFALFVAAAAGWVSFRAFSILKPLAIAVALALALQFLLGVANVTLGLPLALAAAHNAGAALLLACLVVLNYFSFRDLRPS